MKYRLDLPEDEHEACEYAVIDITHGSVLEVAAEMLRGLGYFELADELDGVDRSRPYRAYSKRKRDIA